MDQASELSNQELADAVAVEVMGWTTHPNPAPGRPCWTVPGNRRYRIVKELYSPYANIGETWEVVDRMDELGFFAFMQTPCDDPVYWVRFCPRENREQNSALYYYATAPEFGRAVCIAALDSIRTHRSNGHKVREG